MGVREDYQPYKTRLGFYTNTPGGNTGNDLLFSAEAALVMMKHGVWTGDDTAELDRAIYRHARTPAGFLQRPGWEQDQISLDDFIGVAAYSYKTNQLLAAAMYSYGQEHHFVWGPLQFRFHFSNTNDQSDYHAWLGRFPALIAHIAWAAGRKPSWFQRIAWCLSVAFSGKPEDQDEWILNWLLIEVGGDKGWSERLATIIYHFRLQRAHPGGLAAVFARYFGSSEHPTAKHFRF